MKSTAAMAKLVDALPCLPAGRFEVVAPERMWEFEFIIAEPPL